MKKTQLFILNLLFTNLKVKVIVLVLVGFLYGISYAGIQRATIAATHHETVIFDAANCTTDAGKTTCLK